MRRPWPPPRQRLHGTRSQLDEISATVARQPSIIEEQQSAVASARAKLAFAQANARRYGNLALTGAGSMQEHQQADAALQQGQASLDGAQASLDAARRQLDVLTAQRSAAEAAIRADDAQLDQARLNLSYTRIVAPIDGVVGRAVGTSRQLCRPRRDIDDRGPARPGLYRGELSRSGAAARPQRPAGDHPSGRL